MTRDEAKAAADAVIADLSGRSGLGNEWGMVDHETQEEIRDTWAALIFRAAERVP